jgi:hypothetical protein
MSVSESRTTGFAMKISVFRMSWTARVLTLVSYAISIGKR